MKLLLDTHILIWLLEGNQKLSPRVRQVIEDATNSLYLRKRMHLENLGG